MIDDLKSWENSKENSKHQMPSKEIAKVER